MPERSSLRRRIPESNRRSRPQHPSPSSSSHRRTPASPRRSLKPIEILKRCNSEPSVRTDDGPPAFDDDGLRDRKPPDAVLFRPKTCTDIFSSPDQSLPPQPPKEFGGYNKDSKVVVNVTVEGSPGPVRTMIRLGANVEETIRLVITKYGEEGRCPRLDKDAASTFELHHSHFSLASMDKKDLIGDFGIRSFYLRRGNSGRSSSARELVVSSSFTSEIVSATASTPSPNSSPFFLFLPDYIAQQINQIIRRTRKLWKLFGCLHCS